MVVAFAGLGLRGLGWVALREVVEGVGLTDEVEDVVLRIRPVLDEA